MLIKGLDIKTNQDPEKSWPSLNKTFSVEPLSLNPGSYHLKTRLTFFKSWVPGLRVDQDKEPFHVLIGESSNQEQLVQYLDERPVGFFQIYGEIIQTAVGLEVEQAWAQVQSPGLNFRLAVNKPQA